MKRIVLSLFFLILPVVSWAADSCTNPKDYTVDKRCYVTEEQKKMKPYNAVVSLKKSLCTGTIVNIDNKPYVFTVKHCVDNDGDNEPDEKIVVKLQDGISFYAYKDNVGDYDLKTHGNRSGDWAVYSMKKSIDELPFVYINSDDGEFHVRVVGYGTLKVLSDSEISEFRQLYLDYLDETVGKDRNVSYKYGYSFFSPEIDGKNRYVKQFINDLSQENRKKFFKDNQQLKYSDCYYKNGKEIGCQTWSGSSGGGIFDDNDVIKGVHTTGTRAIGGREHAFGAGNIKL